MLPKTLNRSNPDANRICFLQKVRRRPSNVRIRIDSISGFVRHTRAPCNEWPPCRKEGKHGRHWIHAARTAPPALLLATTSCGAIRASSRLDIVIAKHGHPTDVDSDPTTDTSASANTLTKDQQQTSSSLHAPTLNVSSRQQLFAVVRTPLLAAGQAQLVLVPLPAPAGASLPCCQPRCRPGN